MIVFSIWDIFSTKSLILNFQPIEKAGEAVGDAFNVVKKRVVKPEKVTLVLVGDVMLGRSVMTKSLDQDNPHYPFEAVADELVGADLVLVNLESPIVSDCPRSTEGMVFCSDPRMLEGLTYAGVDVVSLANNHVQDYGEKGLAETVGLLSDAGILTTGMGELVTRQIKNMNFGFLGFNMVGRRSNFSDNELWVVRKSSERVDVLVVSVHWGTEYKKKSNDFQRVWARELVNSGADVVVGHHPHVVQEVGYIQQKPVFYSLGNFVFDQMWSEETRRGLVVKLTFEDGSLVGEERRFVYMQEWARPEFVEGLGY